MKRLLKQYLILAIAVQFVLACLLDFMGLVFAVFYQSMLGRHTELEEPTAFVISIRHWAFVWPVAALLLALVLYRKARTDESSLHLFGGMMLLAVAIMIIALWCLILPVFSTQFFIGDG
jgi:hypothetical protein